MKLTATKKRKAGRPEIKIDWSKVDKYLQAQCNGIGIAGLLGISKDTLYDKCLEDNKTLFSDYSALKKGEGKELLRAKQFSTAMEGDKTMLVWLGKQYLDQKERTDITTGDQPITTIKLIRGHERTKDEPQQDS